MRELLINRDVQADAIRSVQGGIEERALHVGQGDEVRRVKLHVVDLDEQVLLPGRCALERIRHGILDAQRSVPGVVSIEVDPGKTVSPPRRVFPAVPKSVTVAVDGAPVRFPISRLAVRTAGGRKVRTRRGGEDHFSGRKGTRSGRNPERLDLLCRRNLRPDRVDVSPLSTEPVPAEADRVAFEVGDGAPIE